jgi:uncharacterized protein (TIGR03437 family)
MAWPDLTPGTKAAGHAWPTRRSKRQIANGQTQLVSSLQIYFAGTPAMLSYAGLSPGSVGLYQFDVVVPNVSSNNTVPLTFTLGGANGRQTLYTSVQ